MATCISHYIANDDEVDVSYEAVFLLCNVSLFNLTVQMFTRHLVGTHACFVPCVYQDPYRQPCDASH